jgi:hypothetical protein
MEKVYRRKPRPAINLSARVKKIGWLIGLESVNATHSVTKSGVPT